MQGTRLAALTLTAASLGAATGCGGSAKERLTRSALITRADAICRRANDELHGFYKVRTWAEIPAAAAQFAKSEGQLSRELSHLKPPSSMANDWNVIVTSYRNLGEVILHAGQRAKTNPTPNVSLSSELFRIQHFRAMTAARYGFKYCSTY